MQSFEPYANGSRRSLDEDPQPGSFDPLASALPYSGQFLGQSVAALESVLLDDGLEGSHKPDGDVAGLLDGLYFLSTDEYNYDSRMETEQYHRPPIPASSFDSVMSDSTFASGHTIYSSVEQGEDSAENLDDIFELPTYFPWPPEFLPDYEDHFSVYVASHCQANESVRVPVQNDGSFHVEESVTNSGIDVPLPAVSRSAARTWPCFVRLVCACHRFRSKIDMLKGLSKKGIIGKRKRSDESNKYPCEIRISTKIPRDGKYLKEKAWLGTFATPAQKGRALDVGKYFLSAKNKKIFSAPESEATLSAFKGHLQALPLTELVESVTKLAKFYGEKGTLPQSLNDL